MNLKKTRIIFLILTIACIGFIWINSSLDGKESSGISGGVLGMVNDLIMGFGFKKEFSEFLIRKLAHFTEFAGLSFLITTDFKLFKVSIKKCWDKILFLGLMAAVIDETIQLFPVGRTSKITDVWIDFSGICFAFVVTALFYGILEKKNIKYR